MNAKLVRINCECLLGWNLVAPALLAYMLLGTERISPDSYKKAWLAWAGAMAIANVGSLALILNSHSRQMREGGDQK